MTAHDTFLLALYLNMDNDDAGLTLLIYNVWYAYIYKGHHKAKRAGCIAGGKKGNRVQEKGNRVLQPAIFI